SRQIGELMKTGQKIEAEEIKTRTSDLKQKIKDTSEQLQEVEREMQQVLYTIPNTPAEDVPPGNTPEDNITVYQHGELPKLKDQKLPHWELITKYDIIDFELGTKITGAGFPVYKGKGARLQRAMINFFLDQALAQGY